MRDHAHAQLRVHDVRLSEPLELEPELHCVAGGGHLAWVLGEWRAVLVRLPHHRLLEGLDDATVQAGETLEQLAVPEHVGPELEEHRKPAIAAPAAR